MPGTIVEPEKTEIAEPPSDGGAKDHRLRFRPDIEGLRAVAVLMVVFNHLGVPGFRAGFVGVDVFFVISGYLITSLLAREFRRRSDTSRQGTGSISIRGFYRRRVLRILPAALTTIAVVLLAGKLLLNRIAFIKIQSDALWATFFGTNIQLIRQATDYFQTGTAQSPLQNFWSLAVEEQYYVVWPLLFLLVARFAHRRSRGAGWLRSVRVAVVVIGLASLAWSIRSADLDPAAGYFSTLTRAWQLALGALIALTPAIAGRMRGPLAAASGILGGFLLGLALVVCGSGVGYPGAEALIPTLGAALIICAGLGEGGPNPAGWLLSTRIPRGVGRISYSLYLWHWPLIIFAGMLYGKASSTVEARWLLFVLSMVVAVLSYLVIERPFLALSHRAKDAGRQQPRRFGRLRVLWMVLLTTFSLTTIAALARPIPFSDGILPRAGVELTKAQWESRMSAALKHKTLTEHEGVIAEALATRQLLGRIGGRGRPPGTVRGGSKRCKTIMTVTTAEQADDCTRYGLGKGGFAWPSGVKPLVALVGNSFAGQWFYQLQRLLPRNVKLMPLTITSCPTWATGKTGRRDSHGNSCDAQRSLVLTMLRQRRPGLTIVSYQRAHPHREQLDATGPLVRRLGQSSGRVLFIGPAPILDSLGSCLSTSRSLRNCNRILGPTDRSEDKADAREVRAAGGDYVSTQALVCSRLLCPAFIGGKPSRSDGIHLSRWTTRGIASYIVDAIRESVAKAR